ncbi:FAD-binding oxidoreductase [Sphingomonas aurantiaca]
MNLDDHPTVRRLRDTGRLSTTPEKVLLSLAALRDLALSCGADDVGIVEIGREEVEPQRDEILRHYPWTRSLLSIVVKMSREPVRGTPRSVANLEFHRASHKTNEVCASVVARLEDLGVRAVNPSMAFPMEMSQHPGGAAWIVSHKPIAVAAGLGRMGVHRNIIHPKFGNFILLGTVLLDQDPAAFDVPIDFNPCLECNLCVAACPVGAIKVDDDFDFQACFTHNYRDFMGGFTDWVEQVADAKDALDYRRRVNEPETASMWQSLTYGANYKSAYCMAVCPAGEDVIGAYIADKAAHRREVLKPLQERPETIYVVAGTDAEDVARRKWKNKTIKPVGNGMTPRTIAGLLTFMPIVFQPGQAGDLDAVYHFRFTGAETRDATIIIRAAKISIRDGLLDKPDITVTADAKTWLGYLAKEKSIVWAFARRKIRVSGHPRLLLKFGKCFPSPEIKRPHVEVLPEPSLLRPTRTTIQKNDPLSGKLRWSGDLKLSEVIEVTHDVKTFRFVHPEGEDIPFRHQPGQYLTLELVRQDIPTRRSYTIASSPTRRGYIEITVKREEDGLASRWLHDEVRAGTSMKIEGPSGTFVFTGTEWPTIVLIAGGVGITPMMSVLRYLCDTHWPGNIYLLLSFKAPRDYIFADEIREFEQANDKLQVAVIVSDPGEERWDGPTGRIDSRFIASNIPEIALQRFHVCGPTGMMESVKQDLLKLKVPTRQIRMEAFGGADRGPDTNPEALGKVVGTVRFRKSGKSVEARNDATLLGTAERAEVLIDSGCRAGNCGACIVKLNSGDVTMLVEDALSHDDRKSGYILACQARPKGNVELEA